MAALTEADTDTVTVMVGTQVLKTELLINICGFYIHQDPSPILFVQPSQGAAEDFSKERIGPTIAATPALRKLVKPPRTRDSENTIAHKDYPGGSLDFVGSNSPSDLASRPKRIILCDEIDKYPASAGAEGDPLGLAEERASTFKDIGRAKFIRCCSPTTEEESRIGKQYALSDQRKCFVACPHCGHQQILTWAQVKWDKDEAGEHLAHTAGILCTADDCGVIWTEQERRCAIQALEFAPAYGWRQTRRFSCCGDFQEPERWDDKGRSLCKTCGERSPYGKHAGFQASKLYSIRHRLSELVRQFLDARGDPQAMRVFTNTGLAELWRPEGREGVDGNGLIGRAENYGPDDLPDDVLVITGFCDVQGDRLEAQLIGWGKDEEAWPFLYEVIQQDPAQPLAWRELDALLKRTFTTKSGRILRVAAFGVDTGGHHGAEVFAFCRTRRKRRIFPTKGAATKPLWTGRPTRSKHNDSLWLIGTNAAKDAIDGRLRIEPPEEGRRKPGYIHFPAHDHFGPDYFEQLTKSERRETRRRAGQTVVAWVPIGNRRNEALDTFVGALAVRRSLPRSIAADLQYSVVESEHEASQPIPRSRRASLQQPFIPRRRGWLSKGG